MNLIEESVQKNDDNNSKTLKTIILSAMIIIILIIIGIVGYLYYIQKTKLDLSIDDKLNEELKQLLVIEEDGTVYLPIKEVASYFGYESFNGEYNDKSESQSKCYVQSEDEVANVYLGSNKIYKLNLKDNSEEYEYVYAKDPVKAINGILYATAETAEDIFNIAFEYDKEANDIKIYTVPYLVTSYSKIILNRGYTEISDKFVNQKAILDSILIVQNEKKSFGAIGLDGSVILEPKYDDIEYLPNTGDFLVTSNNKVGIISKSKDVKVQIVYDEIKLMDSDAGLYIVKKDGKYGVIDFQGNIKIFIENDEVGINTTIFKENNIKNKYLLADNLIPVKKDKYWGLYNKNGTQLVEFKYDELGYTASTNKNALNLLVIPDYNVIVAQKDKKYTLVNSSGKELFATVADEIYMEISGGEKHYYIMLNDRKIDAIGFLEQSNSNASNSNNNNQNEQQVSQNNDDSRQTNEQDYEENDNNENEERRQQTDEENQNQSEEQDNDEE